MPRNQFTFYRSFFDSIEKLRTNAEKLQAYRAICQYALYEKPPEPEAIKASAQAVFYIAQPILDTARKRSRTIMTDNNLSQQDKEKE